MYHYVKSLQYPVNIKYRNPALAKIIISQYGGPDGELGASLRYLSQRFGMPDKKSKAILNDVGTEELAHLEMVGTLVHQLTDGASVEEMEKAGFGPNYTDHGWGVYPQAAAGFPFNAASTILDLPEPDNPTIKQWQVFFISITIGTFNPNFLLYPIVKQ